MSSGQCLHTKRGDSDAGKYPQEEEEQEGQGRHALKSSLDWHTGHEKQCWRSQAREKVVARENWV